MIVREVQRRKRRIPLPTQDEIRAIRRQIQVRKINLETGSVCCILNGDEFRLQKVNKDAKDKFCLAWEPRRVGLAEFFALRDEAFDKFEEAREEAAAKTKDAAQAESEPKPVQVSLVSPFPAA